MLFLFSNYGPYHIARLESLNNYHLTKDLQAVGIELSRSEKKYPWKTKLDNLSFPIISVISNSSLEETKIIRKLLLLLATLRQVNPIILAISGYFSPSMLIALFWCRLRNKPAILFSETTESDFKRVWWKEKIKSFIVKQFKSALVGGQPHKRYLIKLGMPAEAIFVGYDIVGNDTFHPQKIQNLPKPLERSFFLAVNRLFLKKIFLL